MEKDEYQCAWCKGVFKLIRNEEWSEEKAEEEYSKEFPGASLQNRDIVCDDCWQIVRPNRD